MNSRPNAPINVLVSALILKDFTSLTDEEITEACEFDFRYQYALHTTSFEEQPVIKRMDSMMIESNIRKMGRLELLYTCLSNLVKELHRDGKIDLLKGLEHYADPNDRNRVVYHDQDTPQSERLQKIIDDACSLLPKCEEDYAESEDYQLLDRAIREQTKKDDDGRNVPKGKGDGMDSTTLQNTSDPDATYRMM